MLTTLAILPAGCGRVYKSKDYGLRPLPAGRRRIGGGVHMHLMHVSESAVRFSRPRAGEKRDVRLALSPLPRRIQPVHNTCSERCDMNVLTDRQRGITVHF